VLRVGGFAGLVLMVGILTGCALFLVPVGEADQGYLADVNYQDQDTIWAEIYEGGNLDYLDDEGDELSLIYPEPEAKQQFLDQMQQDPEYQHFLAQLSDTGLTAENAQVVFDPNAYEAYLTVDAIPAAGASEQSQLAGQALISGSISAKRYAIRKPVSSLQNADGGLVSNPTNPVVASPSLASPTVIGDPVDVLVNTPARGKQYCLLQGSYTTGSAVFGRAGCFSQSLRNYQQLKSNPPNYHKLVTDNANFLTNLSKQVNPAAGASSLYITGDNVLIYGLDNPSPTQIQILLSYAKAIRTGTISSASTLTGFVLQEEEDSNVTASHLFGICSVVTNQIFLVTLIEHHGDLQDIKNDIKNWGPVKKLLENRELDASSIDAFVSALAAFVKAGLSIGADDLNFDRNRDFVAGIHQLCHTLDVFATDKVNFTDSEISGAIADLATIIASLANCVASQLASVCTGSQAKDTMAAFLSGLPDGRVPEMRALLIWLRVGAALVNTGNQVVLSILKNTALSHDLILVSYSSTLEALAFTISTVGNSPTQIANDIQNALNAAEQFATQIQGTVNQRIIIDVPSKPVPCSSVTNVPSKPGYTVVVACQDSNGKISVVCDVGVSANECRQLGTQLGLPIGAPVDTLYSGTGVTVQPPPGPSEQGASQCLGPKLCLTEF